MSRFAKQNRVFFIEEPVFDTENSHMQLERRAGLTVVIPHLQAEGSGEDHALQQVNLLKELFRDENITDYFFWYYTPMALAIGNSFSPQLIIYDCMDELSNFKFAPPELKEKEMELFAKADLVFTGGFNLYHAKKNSHNNIHPYPSSIDKEHFAKARSIIADPEDQAGIPHPRFGFFGVIDERFDIELIKEVAERKPDWHFIILGPVVKIDAEILPRLNNIHYPGGKNYDDLPKYLASWDIALIPFLRNESTEYISPTKTPEYLAGGKPVISTSIIDVITPYGTNNLVHIADTADEFISAADKILSTTDHTAWLQKIDLFISENSWDKTWNKMKEHINNTINAKQKTVTTNIVNNLNNKENVYV
ncbi:MAG TPA: glycosyltransferase [Chitinophagaceae bacterium]|nr:glycosyltransferase [Chitinophagaceae bacterium]